MTEDTGPHFSTTVKNTHEYFTLVKNTNNIHTSQKY